jgi:hypothetical protein
MRQHYARAMYEGLCTVTAARGTGSTVIVSLPFAVSP